MFYFDDTVRVEPFDMCRSEAESHEHRSGRETLGRIVRVESVKAAALCGRLVLLVARNIWHRK